ncbi:MAG TPA: cytochrome P450 [Propionibacteriaceae bacterium]|nr:cytochrome P450 [Propionibacteriaceae bacterium]
MSGSIGQSQPGTAAAVDRVLSGPASKAAGTSGCPVRKLSRPDDRLHPQVECTGDGSSERWVVRSFETAREVLRSSTAVKQAGFAAERIDDATSGMRPPILYLEAEAHQTQRKAAARLFAPKVTEAYRPMIEQLSKQLVDQVGVNTAVDLSQLSLRLAVQVAARVVGLTNSSVAGLSRRLDRFFDGDPTLSSRSVRSVLRSLRSSSAVLRFYYLDVKPAIRERRRERRTDVISQLLDAGFPDVDILTECVTYAAAGMATTREFITVAVWHLLDDADLLRHYRQASTGERGTILSEILRVEPVIGHLYRRTIRPLTLATADGPVDISEGSLIDIDIRAVNADSRDVTGAPLTVRPGRELPRSVPSSGMSFGDGNHRCPGAPIAILETEIFVSTLLEHDVMAESAPQVKWNDLTQGYDLDRFLIRRRGRRGNRNENLVRPLEKAHFIGQQ